MFQKLLGLSHFFFTPGIFLHCLGFFILLHGIGLNCHCIFIDGCHLAISGGRLLQLFKRKEKLFALPGKRGFPAICPLDVAVVTFKVDTGSHVQCPVD